jgi:uncharacterized membrane protein
MLDYVVKAAGAWFVGFFPLAEIYVAVPAAVAAGLDDLSIIVWTVFGNFTPALLIAFLYQGLTRMERLRAWLERLHSEKVKARVDRYGLWFVLLLTPWTGMWVMAVTAKAVGMNTNRFLIASFISILVYAIALLLLLRAGISVFNEA